MTDLPHITLDIPKDSDDESNPASDDAQEEAQFPMPQSMQRISVTKTSDPKKRRNKVALAPGYSGLDWARLKSSGESLTQGGMPYTRITPSELARHNRKDDAWSAFNGRVYNITPYLKFHPGGVYQLLRVAGKDGTELFSACLDRTQRARSAWDRAVQTHAWISVENMLDTCLIGPLVREPLPPPPSQPVKALIA